MNIIEKIEIKNFMFFGNMVKSKFEIQSIQSRFICEERNIKEDSERFLPLLGKIKEYFGEII